MGARNSVAPVTSRDALPFGELAWDRGAKRASKLTQRVLASALGRSRRPVCADLGGRTGIHNGRWFRELGPLGPTDNPRSGHDPISGTHTCQLLAAELPHLREPTASIFSPACYDRPGMRGLTPRTTRDACCPHNHGQPWRTPQNATVPLCRWFWGGVFGLTRTIWIAVQVPSPTTSETQSASITSHTRTITADTAMEIGDRRRQFVLDADCTPAALEQQSDLTVSAADTTIMFSDLNNRITEGAIEDDLSVTSKPAAPTPAPRHLQLPSPTSVKTGPPFRWRSLGRSAKNSHSQSDQAEAGMSIR